jgi:hypothetical protein
VDVLAWRADGAVAWVGQSNWTFAVTRAEPTPTDPYPFPQLSTIGTVTEFGQESVVPGVTPLTYRSVGGRISEALGWKVDGSSLISYEFTDPDRSVCERVVRAGPAPQVPIRTSCRSGTKYGSPSCICWRMTQTARSAPKSMSRPPLPHALATSPRRQRGRSPDQT